MANGIYENNERELEVKRLADPILDMATGDLAVAGLEPGEAARVVVLYGIGMMAGVLGNDGAAHSMRSIADFLRMWAELEAKKLEEGRK